MQEIVIEAGQGNRRYFKDLWTYRELLVFFAWRDILVRYKQTVIGVAWSVLRPIVTMLVFTIIFGRLAKFPSDGVPYPILVFVAMLPWQAFAGALTASSNSLVANAGMISKIYFPRLVIPTSAVVVTMVDFLISLAVLGFLMLWYAFVPSWHIVTIPCFILLALMASLGMGIWFAALNVRYRDFQYIVPFLVQLGLYVSPVGFSSSIIPDKWRLLYSLNPMVGVIDGFRWAVLGGDSAIYLPGLIMSVVIIFSLLWSGLVYFRKTERTFADVI